MKFLLLACLVAGASAAYTWDSCGTRLDRLKTQKVSVAGDLKAGSKVSVTATGTTDLHVPLDSGAWQVRIYETGEAKSTHTEVGDLMSALKFLDAKNTTFEMKVSFTLPAKKASGEFSANVVAVDQAKADYLCLDVKYDYATAMEALVAPPAATCLHDVDTEDHKCFEACSPEGKSFKEKGLTSAGACPGSYNFVEKTKVVEQCPDGVTNLRYCASVALNVTLKTKGEAGVTSLTEAMVGGVAHCKKDADCPSSYCQNGVCHACGDECCLTDKDCPGSYCANDPTKMPPYTCHGTASASTSFTAPAPPAQPFCLHHVDTEDHKCFEYCQMDGKTFADKGVDAKGGCDGSFNTVDKTEVITQCPDGVTNLRYCASTALNVTLKTKGQAGVVEMMAPEDNSAYCMNDKSKHAPFYCHCPPLPTNCKTDKDCSNPWFKSYCMNDASKAAPYVCKQVMPPTCSTDKDCQQ